MTGFKMIREEWMKGVCERKLRRNSENIEGLLVSEIEVHGSSAGQSNKKA